jgi:hypothetical protein
LKTTDSPLELECDLADDLPLLPEELKLVQDLLPELLKEMAWQQNDKER